MGTNTTARLVLRRHLPCHVADMVMHHVLAELARRQKKWHFLLTRDMGMLCRQFAYNWKWLAPSRRGKPSFFSRVRRRSRQRLEFVNGWYLLGGRADAYVRAIEEIARPSGARTSAGDETRAEIDVRYCWMRDQRRYFCIRQNRYDHCDACHSWLSTKWCSWCSRCEAFYCYECRCCCCVYVGPERKWPPDSP
jgi:hypothetical protein